MYTYTISGDITFNEADTESGFETIEIRETVEVAQMGAEKALFSFLESQQERYSFFGKLISCDAETKGNRGATFHDGNESQTIDVEIEGYQRD